MREAAKRGHFDVERLFAGVTKGGMAEVVSQRQGFCEVLVETECAADRSRNLRYLEAMGQPGAIMVPLMIDEDLRLVGQPPKRGRMDDAVAIALKRRAHRMLRLRMEAPAGLLRLRRIGRERSDHRRNLRRTGRGVHPQAQRPAEGRRRDERHIGLRTRAPGPIRE